jgi:hypothetical protein
MVLCMRSSRRSKKNGYRDIKKGVGNNNNHQIQELEEVIYQIQEGVQNGYNGVNDEAQLLHPPPTASACLT